MTNKSARWIGIAAAVTIIAGIGFGTAFAREQGSGRGQDRGEHRPGIVESIGNLFRGEGRDAKRMPPPPQKPQHHGHGLGHDDGHGGHRR